MLTDILKESSRRSRGWCEGSGRIHLRWLNWLWVMANDWFGSATAVLVMLLDEHAWDTLGWYYKNNIYKRPWPQWNLALRPCKRYQPVLTIKVTHNCYLVYLTFMSLVIYFRVHGSNVWGEQTELCRTVFRVWYATKTLRVSLSGLAFRRHHCHQYYELCPWAVTVIRIKTPLFVERFWHLLHCG